MRRGKLREGGAEMEGRSWWDGSDPLSLTLWEGWLSLLIYHRVLRGNPATS